jgi:hypothetical protein
MNEAAPTSVWQPERKVFLVQEELPPVGALWVTNTWHARPVPRQCLNKCYVRNEMRRLWSSLCKSFKVSPTQRVCMLVTGDAGVGKSTVLLGWALWTATEYSTKVLVITTEGISVSYLASTNNCIEVGTLGTEDISLLFGQIESKFGTYTDWDIVVLDGFDAEGTRLISNTLVSLKLLFPCAFLVHCSSTDSVEMSNRTMEALNPLKRDRMGAWTFDDVSAAWDASRRENVPLFPLASLMSPSLFVRKYHLAGGNYRDMLGNECVVRDGILAEAERVTNAGAFLAEMHMDSPKVPNTLIVHVRSGSRHSRNLEADSPCRYSGSAPTCVTRMPPLSFGRSTNCGSAGALSCTFLRCFAPQQTSTASTRAAYSPTKAEDVSWATVHRPGSSSVRLLPKSSAPTTCEATTRIVPWKTCSVCLPVESWNQCCTLSRSGTRECLTELTSTTEEAR